jgi:hypothetical protein
MTKPLELLQSQRVYFADTLKTHDLTLEMQLASLDPLDLQLVVDALPKTDLRLRGPQFAKPKPMAYLHLRAENTAASDQLIENAIVLRMILAYKGCTQDLATIQSDMLRLLADPHFGIIAKTAKSTQIALEQIARAREGLLQEAQP